MRFFPKLFSSSRVTNGNIVRRIGTYFFSRNPTFSEDFEKNNVRVIGNVFKQYFFNSHILPFDPRKLKSQVLDIAKVMETVDGSLILEIGCGSGHLLQEFSSQGAQAIGIEPSAAQANAASEHGIRIITGGFDEKTVDEFLHLYGRADLVVIDNSSKMQHPIHLSNVADPLNYVGNLANLIKPEGKVVVRAP